MGSPFRVLGIALVVEQKGKGAQLVVRYPAANVKNLFLNLPPRVMAKLFRPKKPLCGQPVTLSVGNTVFCCRAVLLEPPPPQEQQQPSQHDHHDNDEPTPQPPVKDSSGSSPLVLFNVIVALVPTSTFHNNMTNNNNNTTDSPNPHCDIQQQQQHQPTASKTYSVEAIRQVHTSLARLVRVLEREERRCCYVSQESSRILDMAKQFRSKQPQASPRQQQQQKQHGTAHTIASANTKNTTTTANTSPHHHHHKADNSDGVGGGGSSGHRRTLSNAGSALTVLTDAAANTDAHHVSSGDSSHPPTTTATTATASHQQEAISYEQEQEWLEWLLASSSQQQQQQQQQGSNLAIELVQVFHALSRRPHEYTPTPSMLLSGSQGIVYIHRHLAVPIESVHRLPSTILANTSGEQAPPTGYRTVPRPYHTLLFPHATPSELVKTLSSSPLGSNSDPKTRTALPSPQQRLQQLLLMASPRKSLQDMADDTALPLQVVLDLAQYLVQQNACVLAPCLTRSTRLVATRVVARGGVNGLPTLSLAFSQRFPGHDLRVVTSLLTTSYSGSNHNPRTTTLGDSIALLSSSSTTMAVDASSRGASDARRVWQAATQGRLSARTNESTSSVEELVYAMAVWLRAHQVVVELEDFLVAVGAYSDTVTASSTAIANPNSVSSNANERTNIPNDTTSTIPDNNITTTSTNPAEGRSWNPSSDSPEEVLFQELVDAEALTGRMSSAALCWRFGLAPPVFHGFRSWGLLHHKLRVITRIAEPEDDC